MASAQDKSYFLKPNRFERAAGKTFAALVRLGIGMPHHFVLEVRGRKSGKVFSTPVNLLLHNGRKYLVAARGETNWVRNARAGGRVRLCKGSRREEYEVREIAVAERPQLLKEFLDRFAFSVQRYYPVPKSSPAQAFAEFAGRMPVFELIAAAS